MSLRALFDVAPSTPPVTGYASLAAVLIAVLLLTGGFLLGLILLIKRIKRRRAKPLAGAPSHPEDHSPD